jgi:tetratricopeptide (TPR) repeat protein
MKRTILILAALAITTSLVIHFYPSPTPQMAAPIAALTLSNASNPVALKPVKPIVQTVAEPDTSVANPASNKPAPGSLEAIAYRSALDTLVSPHSTYAERQAALAELKDSGRLADAAEELEKLTAANPNNATYPTALGEVNLRLCSTTTDVRSQAVWAMTADADFEAALNIDPTDWDARFTKSVAMTYWPANLNKGQEIIQNFNTLIQQQQQESPQPEFANTYVWLGKEYQQLGQTAQAQQTWQQGAALYPNNSSLQNLLSANAAPAGQ